MFPVITKNNILLYDRFCRCFDHVSLGYVRNARNHSHTQNSACIYNQPLFPWHWAATAEPLLPHLSSYSCKSSFFVHVSNQTWETHTHTHNTHTHTYRGERHAVALTKTSQARIYFSTDSLMQVGFGATLQPAEHHAAMPMQHKHLRK